MSDCPVYDGPEVGQWTHLRRSELTRLTERLRKATAAAAAVGNSTTALATQSARVVEAARTVLRYASYGQAAQDLAAELAVLDELQNDADQLDAMDGHAAAMEVASDLRRAQ